MPVDSTIPALIFIPPSEIMYWDKSLAVPPLSSNVTVTLLDPYFATTPPLLFQHYPLANATVYVKLGLLEPPIVAFTRIYLFTVPLTVFRSPPTLPAVVKEIRVAYVVSSALC
jgi:hypothetical protein